MKYTKKLCKTIFSEEMIPCPKCGSYHLGYQTPIVMKEPVEPGEGPREILRKYARTVKRGVTPLEGPCYIHCRECHHRGPTLDCSGRTSEEVGRDPVVARELRRLWNSQGS